MLKQNKILTINLLTSKIFWSSPPLIIEEAKKRGHNLIVFSDKNITSVKKLLNCDIFIDFSTITKMSFYKALKAEYQRRLSRGIKVPLMVDPPEAVMISMDKRRTHAIFSDYIPESYNLDGLNNERIINNFIDDQYVVIKNPTGWQSEGVERFTPKEALKKFKNSKNLIIQKYIPFTKGIGRILTLNHLSDFKIICAYLRIPISWKTGEGDYSCKLISVNKKLYNFAKFVSIKSGLYLNGIDYIYFGGRYNLLEVNAAPGLREPYDEFKINTPKILFDHIERNL